MLVLTHQLVLTEPEVRSFTGPSILLKDRSKPHRLHSSATSSHFSLPPACVQSSMDLGTTFILDGLPSNQEYCDCKWFSTTSMSRKSQVPYSFSRAPARLGSVGLIRPVILSSLLPKVIDNIFVPTPVPIPPHLILCGAL
jgi:hypothetical protein